MGKSYELRLGNGTKYPLNGGISLDEETLIDLSQSPYDGLLNMCLDNGGTLGKRQGQEYILSNDLLIGITIKFSILFPCFTVQQIQFWPL